MRVCPSCGHENQPQNRFCLKCGSPLGEEAEALARDESVTFRVCASCGHQNRAENRVCVKCGSPLAEEAQPTAEEARPIAEEALPVSASGVVYLYGDHFVGGGLPGGRIELPCREVKVKKKELAETGVAAAFVALAQGRHARLYIDRRSGTLGIFKHKAVFLQPLEGAGTLPSGFEGRILNSLSDRQGSNNAVDIVRRLVPESKDPWAVAIELIREGLLEQGYFAEGERGRVTKLLLGRKLLPDCQRIATLQGQVEPVRSVIESFRMANPKMHTQLLKDVRAAIKAQERVRGEDWGNDDD